MSSTALEYFKRSARVFGCSSVRVFAWDAEGIDGAEGVWKRSRFATRFVPQHAHLNTSRLEHLNT